MPRGTIAVLFAGVLLLAGSTRAEDEQTTFAEADPFAAPSETGPGAERLKEYLSKDIDRHRRPRRRTSARSTSASGRTRASSRC